MQSTLLGHARHVVMVCVCALSISGCGIFDPAEEGPNELSGDPNIELTHVGQRFGAYLNLSPWLTGVYHWNDSVTVTKNDGGIVTMNIAVESEQKVLDVLDTLFGTSGLPRATKLEVLDAVAAKFGATIDTSVAGKIKIAAMPKFKITASGIQEFVSGGGDVSKPFTIIKYNAGVGDSWTFTRPDGKTVRMTVTYHSSTADYLVGFWMMKVFNTESVEENDPLIEKIVFVTNHKYGAVGVHNFT